MLQIVTSNDVPDNTYFRTNSVEPILEGNTLTVYSGTGTRRSSWGEPGTTSTAVLKQEQLVAIHVGFHHKHGGGQFWRYYRHDGQWQRVTWQQLNDDERRQVLDAYENNCAPSWAKVPGKLRTSYAQSATKTYTTYKIVEIVDGKLYSVFDGQTEYILGKRLAEKAVSDHGGGYYSYPSAEGVERAFHAGTLFPKRCYTDMMDLALIECEIGGTVINYDGRKYASTYLRPVREVKRFHYTPKIEEAC